MRRAAMLLAALAIAGMSQGLSAQSATLPTDAVILEGGEGAVHTGRLAVNIAARGGNQQASSAILAIGDAALTEGSIAQHTEADAGDRVTQIVLGPGAFSGLSGLASINITTGATFFKLVGIIGGAFVTGEIGVDGSAVAMTDAKQLQQGIAVTYREENELNGENGYVDPVAGDRHRSGTGIEAVLAPRTARIGGGAAGFGGRRMRGDIPVEGPFPDIADHVV